MAELLHYNDFAYVARRPANSFLHVCFGTLAVALTAAELQDLRRRVAALPFPAADPNGQLLLATPAQRWAVVLTAHEAGQLLEVLNVAALLLEAEELLNPGRSGGQVCADCPYAG
jgi:hypothetical protein